MTHTSPHSAQRPRVPMHPAVTAATPRGVISTSVVLGWAAALSMTLLFLLIGTVVQHLIEGTQPGIGHYLLGVVLGVLSGAFTACGSWCAEREHARTESRLRRSIISQVFTLGSTFAAAHTGTLLSLSTQAVDRAALYRAGFIGPIIGALTSPLLVLALMAVFVDAVTAGWLTLLLLIVPCVIRGFQRMVAPIGGRYRRSQAALTTAFLEAISSLSTLAYARATERTGRRLARQGEEHRRSLMRMLAGNQLIILVVDAAFSLTIIVSAVGLIVVRLRAGHLDGGEAVSIVLMTLLIIGPVDVIGQFFYIGIAGRASESQISALLWRMPAWPQEQGSAHQGGAAIVFDDVTVAWPDNGAVFEGLSFSIERGERVAFVGPSGAGKSTVSALIQAHLLPAAGQVRVNGLDTSTIDPELVRAQLSVVEQHPFLFMGSIAENLRLAAPEATDDHLRDALTIAGLLPEVDAFPSGMNTQVGEEGRLLSGGQAQRLSIARAALRNSPILLLDEPTSQVDLAGEAGILEALEALSRGRTVFMIAHRPNAILAADRILDIRTLVRKATS